MIVGKEVLVKCDKIKSGHTKSCGCLLTEHCMKAVVKMREALPTPREPWKSTAKEVLSCRYIDKGMKEEDKITLEQFIELTKLNCAYCGAEPSNKYNSAKDDKKSSQYAKDNRRFYL